MHRDVTTVTVFRFWHTFRFIDFYEFWFLFEKCHFMEALGLLQYMLLVTFSFS